MTEEELEEVLDYLYSTGTLKCLTHVNNPLGTYQQAPCQQNRPLTKGRFLLTPINQKQRELWE
jgi:hypothetical protein